MAEIIGVTGPHDQIEAGKEVVKDVLDDLPSDAELVAKINFWMRESRSYHDEMLKEQKKAEDYYLGKQTNAERIPRNMSNFVQNRIFESVETILPGS